VECCVEAGNLRQFGAAGEKRADGSEIVRLVQWRQRHVTLKLSHDVFRYAHRATEVRTAMNDPMADGHESDLLRGSQPIACFLGGGRKIRDLFRRESLVNQRCLVGALSSQARPSANAIHLAFDETVEILALAIESEDLKLKARGAGVDDQNRIHGGHTAATAVFRGRGAAKSTAIAQEAMRARTESARDVRMTGTRAPRTIPAASARARNIRFLASIFPASRSGTTRICARPATSDLMPLILTASGSMALSNASGPSSAPPVICPRSAILHSAAASMVDGIFEVTVSTAERMATLGVPRPVSVQRSMAFCTISRLASRSGKMLIAASVMNNVSA